MRIRRQIGWSSTLLLAALLSGCLPSSCNRTESRALFPADSVSRTLALTLPVDTLEFVGVIGETGTLEIGYPRTVAYAPDGLLWMSDTERHRLTAFEPSGEIVAQIDVSDHEYPYLAGFQGDTLLVFSPTSRLFVQFHESEPVGTIPLPDDIPKRGSFQYALATGDGLYYKVIAEDFQGYISRLDGNGNVLDRWDLEGEFWRYAGMLRSWGDSLLSLSGFRPVVHVLYDQAPVETMALLGFDSPMLARSRRFVTGDLAEPPLLTASAAATGNYLFVLNMRPGWLRVDVYGHDGKIRFILTQPSPEFNQEYFPSDIAVKQVGENIFQLAVTVIEPEARIELYRWHSD